MPNFEDPAFGELFDRFADARVVLLGEATHGTSEFYCARAAITRRLVEQHGFTIVAVEADWPDAATIDRYVRHKAPITATEPAFRRFPTWMWRNVEVHDFVDWLRAHNALDRVFIDLRAGRAPALYESLLYPRLERAIGVIYRPETELASHYFDASLPRQFDAYLWFVEARAVEPLTTTSRAGVPETYPFGL